MSVENVEIVRRAFEDFRAGKNEFDSEGMLTKFSGEDVLDPAIELDIPEGLPDISGVHRGKDAVRLWWQEWLAAWQPYDFVYELIDAGDRVVALIDQRVRGRSTGIEMRMKFAHVITLKDGLWVHWKIYMSQSKALEAVGLQR